MEDGNDAAVAANGLNYGSDWVFDNSLVISVCSDYNGMDSVGCKAQNLKMFYSIYEWTSTIDFANEGFFFTRIFY